MRAVFDTSVLLDQLKGVEAAPETISQYDGMVSNVTVVELLAAAQSSDQEEAARELLSLFEVVHSNDNISEEALKLRRATNLSANDATIYATAKDLKCLLVTSNTEAFSDSWEDVKIPYRVY